MNNSKSILTISYKLNEANRFISSLNEDNCYLYAGVHTNSDTVIQPTNSTAYTVINSYNNMIFGKKIDPNDAVVCVRRVDWQSGVIYTPYDHRNDSLYDEDFYVVAVDGDVHNVFKCIENGNGAPSTVQPSILNVNSSNDDFFYPSDGYRWKHMYSISSDDFNKFATSLYIPAYVDANNKSHAIDKRIDAIKVESQGAGYSNYLFGTFGLADVRLNGDGKKYGISASGVKTSNDFYSGCYLYISAGDGAGQYRKIVSYSSNSTHNFVVLDSEFDSASIPQNGSLYEIMPGVEVQGDGSETSEAKARAIINPIGNTVFRIEMLDKGENYNTASATVTAADVVGVLANASVVPIYSPVGGHAYNPPLELGSKGIIVYTQFVGDESGTIPVNNDYSQIGIIRNPKFNNVSLNLINSNRDFYSDEWVYKIDPIQLQGAVISNRDGSGNLTGVLTLANTTGPNSFRAGDNILVHYGTEYLIANVDGVSNSSILIDKNITFDTHGDTANVYISNAVKLGRVSSFSVNNIELTEVGEPVSVGDEIIGVETGTHAYVSNVHITSIQKNFSTYVQCYRYTASFVQGNFQFDEEVYQISNTAATAKFHSIDLQDTLYVTNQVGTFNVSGSNNQIIGASSGAVATLSNKYLPDLMYGSGDIVYIENGESITRTNEKSETFRFVFQF